MLDADLDEAELADQVQRVGVVRLGTATGSLIAVAAMALAATVIAARHTVL